MTDNSLILGADLGKGFLNLSCYKKNQIEMTNQNDVWQEEELSDKLIFKKIKEFLREQGAEDNHHIKLVFSCDDSCINMVKEVERSLFDDGFRKENLRKISRENAFIHFILNQDEDIRQHTVMLFDFDGATLFCYRMVHSKKKSPLNFKAEKTLLGTFDRFNKANDTGNCYDEKFAGIARKILSKEVVSGIYLTGKGFEGDWLKKSLKILCDGRRAFVGQNLFSAGCCYYGSKMEGSTAKGYMIQTPETVLYESGVLDGANKDDFTVITEAGNAWYETKGSIDVILDRPGKVDIVFVNTITKEKQVESVDVSALSDRPRKVGRLHIEVQFFGSKTGVITVCDKGFGDFWPASHQVFFHEFSLI